MTLILGSGSTLSNDLTRLYGIIMLTALAMGIRSATVRKLAVPDFTTTVLTQTLAGLAGDSTLAGGTNAGWARRSSSVVALFAGAAAGAWLLRHSIALPLAVGSVVSGGCALAAYFAKAD